MDNTKQAKEMSKENGLDEAINQTYIGIVGEEYAEAGEAEEAYQGEYKTDEDFVMELLKECGDIPEDLPSYVHIDWESTSRDIMQDYSDDNGHYFRNL